jgi:hypothetical protein
MKIWKSYKIWGMVFVCFVLIWMGQTGMKTYRISVENAKAKYELEMRIERGAEQPDKGQKGQWPKRPVVPKKEPFDVWGWVVKIGGGLTGLKTLLEIIDKFRKKTILEGAK